MVNDTGGQVVLMGDWRYAYKVSACKLKRSRRKTKCISKLKGGIWTRAIWFKMEPTVDFCEHNNLLSASHKRREIR
jgi:hypothetical protein